MTNKAKEFSSELDKLFGEKSMYLCRLDADAGDGDHGITISRGFRTGNEEVQKLADDVSIAMVCKTLGYGMLASMGGASGPIFSTFFIQAAGFLRGKVSFTGPLLRDIVHETILAIGDLAGTKVGEKTMVDALSEALAHAQRVGDDLSDVLQALECGALEGANATKDMLATKGRAKFLGEGSRGFIDAGSMSVYYIMQTLNKVFGGDR